MNQYPGLGRPLRHYPSRIHWHAYPVGHDEYCYDNTSELLPVREVAMMIIIDRLTDKPEWEKKVFSEDVVAKWRTEALHYPDDLLWRQASNGKQGKPDLESDEDSVGHFSYLRTTNPLKNIITDSIFDYCVQELRNKANYYMASGLIPTLDSRATVVKSDTLIDRDLHDSLRQAFTQLKADQAHSPDWHPNTDKKVQDLVRPSMFPLVYGQSRVFQDEVVGIQDAIQKWAGKGNVIPEDLSDDSSDVPSYCWSSKYQWLPANVAFQDDGTVRFKSYINNLHPNRYPGIYRALERLIETALPMWDQCLENNTETPKQATSDRSQSRFPLPEDPDDDNGENWLPPDPLGVIDVDSNWRELHPYPDELEELSEKHLLQQKWKLLREPVQPDPSPFSEIDYAPVERLADKFRKSGLQVIIKMASIELTPDKPEFPAGSWHLEGQMNERICATTLYYVDSENITTSSLSFRMQTDDYVDEKYSVGQDGFHWLEQVHGTELKAGGDIPCIQNYGSVETPQGRLLAFPNVFQHSVSSFRLIDPGKPGHRRFIALWLVDPHVRIISTANVPPQQQDWWVESLLGRTAESRQAALSKLPVEVVQLLKEKGLLDADAQTEAPPKLPTELVDVVRSYFDAPMSNEQAKAHREQLMKERTAFQSTADDNWHGRTYNFCGH